MTRGSLLQREINAEAGAVGLLSVDSSADHCFPVTEFRAHLGPSGSSTDGLLADVGKFESLLAGWARSPCYDLHFAAVSESKRAEEHRERTAINDVRHAPCMHPGVSSRVIDGRFISRFTRGIDIFSSTDTFATRRSAGFA